MSSTAYTGTYGVILSKNCGVKSQWYMGFICPYVLFGYVARKHKLNNLMLKHCIYFGGYFVTAWPHGLMNNLYFTLAYFVMQAFKRVLRIPTVFDLIYFFWKMPCYTYFFFLKCHLRVKIQKFSLTHSEREDLIGYRINFSGSTLQNISHFFYF